MAVANRLNSITSSFATESAVFQQASNGSFIQVTTVGGSAVSDILPITVEGNTYIVVGSEFTGTLNDADYTIPVEIYR